MPLMCAMTLSESILNNEINLEMNEGVNLAVGILAFTGVTAHLQSFFQNNLINWTYRQQ